MSRIHRINISRGGVPKLPVESAFIGPDGVEGDVQADRKHHGGPLQHLCLWSLDVIEALQEEGHPIEPGFAGENITITDLDWAPVAGGLRLQLGRDVVAEVTEPATPCAKNRSWFVDGDYQRMSHETHPGWSRWYARVITPGPIRVGDPVRVLNRSNG